jgi:hypothetical protein
MKKLKLEDMTPNQLRMMADDIERKELIDSCPKPLDTIDVKSLINLAVMIVEDIITEKCIVASDYEECFDTLLKSVYGPNIISWVNKQTISIL